jgi:hypothetical protein
VRQRQLQQAREQPDGAFATPFDRLRASGAPLSSCPAAHVYIGTGALKNFNGQIGINAATATPINIRTGYGDNCDLIFNDRPVGLGGTRPRRRQWNING